MTPRRNKVDSLGRWIPASDWPMNRQAPGDLELVRRFVNTVNRESGADLLGTPADFQDWLESEAPVGASFASFATSATQKQITQAVHLRSLLQGLITCVDVGKFLRGLNDFSQRYPVILRFDPEARLEPAVSVKDEQPNADSFFVRILTTVYLALQHDTWSRLKPCSNEECGWVIYDRSKNQAAIWCSDQACGGRSRARAYRSREHQR
jgi:predicted RNA-binding Zn ribbon-like protein